MSKNKCKCITAKGTNCSRTGRYKGYCYQHSKYHGKLNHIQKSRKHSKNFVITVADTVEPEIFTHMKAILDSYGAVSTGNQCGEDNISEYYFGVDIKYLNVLQQTLLQQIRNNNITFSTIS